MVFEKFVKLLLSKEISIVPIRYSGEGGILDFTRSAMAKHLTGFMSFGCDTCPASHNKQYDKRCCGQCRFDVGYLRTIPSSIRSIEYYARRFSNTHGFWTTKGCSLDREMRSEICTTHSCYGRAKFSAHEFAIQWLINNGSAYVLRRIKCEPQLTEIVDKYVVKTRLQVDDLLRDYFVKKAGPQEYLKWCSDNHEYSPLRLW